MPYVIWQKEIRKGYLSKVNYKLFCDNIDWDVIPELSEQDYTIKQLNKKLFIPQEMNKSVMKY